MGAIATLALAVNAMIAALGVFGTGSSWPDLLTATGIASLALSGGLAVLRQSRRELHHIRTGLAAAPSNVGIFPDDSVSATQNSLISAVFKHFYHAGPCACRCTSKRSRLSESQTLGDYASA
jgi:hypothetical protein